MYRSYLIVCLGWNSFQSQRLLRETQELPGHSATQKSCLQKPVAIRFHLDPSLQSQSAIFLGLAMNDARIPTFLFLLLVAFAVLQCVHVYPQLPDVMASHFDAHGTPNGWQPKSAFFILIAVVILICTIPAFIVPRRLPSMSTDKINLPNKSYWLSPERREETWRFFRVQMAWWGCALLFILLYAMFQAINANLPSVGRFNSEGMWYALVAFLLFTIVWVVHLIRHFSKLPELN